MKNGSQPVILIVDDTVENLHVLAGLLQPQYRVLAATSGERCLALARGQPMPDLILLDIMMPGLDGYQTLERLRADPATREIPVIFVTAMGGSGSAVAWPEVGAVDYITKPIDPPIVLARVHTQLELKHARDLLKDKNAWLEAEVARRMAENETIQTSASARWPTSPKSAIRRPATTFTAPRTMCVHWHSTSGPPAFRAVFSPNATSTCSSSRRRCTISARWAYPTRSCSSPAR